MSSTIYAVDTNNELCEKSIKTNGITNILFYAENGLRSYVVESDLNVIRVIHDWRWR